MNIQQMIWMGLLPVLVMGNCELKNRYNFNNYMSYEDYIKSIDNSYDLVITDLEPISAYAAKVNKIPCIGIGHQYSFYKKILEDELQKNNASIISPPIRATYDSPFTFPMNRRNEAMFKVEFN